MSDPRAPSPDHIARLNEQIDRAIAQAAQPDDVDGRVDGRLGVQFMEAVRGPLMALPDGRRIVDVAVWIDAPAEPRAVFYAALHLLRGIRAHGAGRVWWLAPTPNGRVINLVTPYEKGTELDLKGADGGDCVRLRSLYFHEALAESALLEERILEHIRKSQRAHQYRVHPRDFRDAAQRLRAKVTLTDGDPGSTTMVFHSGGISAHVVTDASVPLGTFETP